MTQMPAKEAAKVLRDEISWQFDPDSAPMHSPDIVIEAMRAAVAALESQHPRERAMAEDANNDAEADGA